MFDALDYLSTNSLTAYPFKDDSSLTPIDSTSRISDDLFVDFQLTSTNSNIKRAALKSFKYTYGDIPAYTIVISVYSFVSGAWVTQDLTITKTAAFVSVNKPIYYTYTGSAISQRIGIKLICGNGLTAFIANSTKTYIFNTDIQHELLGAEFTPSTIIPAPIMLTQFSVYNPASITPVIDVVVDNNTTPKEIKLNAGANIVGIYNSNLMLNVIPGAGTGLYDACADPDGIISINGILPDNKGNFSFSADDCYALSPGIHTASLGIYHTCRPKCTEAEVNGFAYYANRIKDGLLKVGQYAGLAVSNLQTTITSIQQKHLANIVSPYIAVTDAISTQAGKDYISIGVGIYDPNKQKLNLTLTATPDTAVETETAYIADPTSVNWVQLDNVSYLQGEGVKTKLAQTIADNVVTYFSNRMVNCRSINTLNTVLLLSNTPTPAANRTIEFQLKELDGATVLSTAYSYHNILPTNKPYFNVSSRRGISNVNTAFAVYTITIDLYNSLTSWSGNTALLVNTGTPSSNKYISGLPVWSVDNTDTTITPSSGNINLNWNVPYPKKARLTFNLMVARTVGPISIIITDTVFGHDTGPTTLTFI